MNRTSFGEREQDQQDEGNGVRPGEGARPRRGRPAFDRARMRELSRNLGLQLKAQTGKRPYVMLGAAASIGFIAGSLFGSRLGQVALAAGIGYVAKNVLQGNVDLESLGQRVEQHLDGLTPERAKG
jgi:hypothetical protein